MTVIEIVQGYLEQNGYDGLFYPGECACRKSDLAPCGNINEQCQPGYLQPCPESCGEHDWHINAPDNCLHAKKKGLVKQEPMI